MRIGYLPIATILQSSFLALFILFVSRLSAQGDATLIVKGQTTVKVRGKGLGLNSGVKAVNWNDEDLEGVEVEVKKNGASIARTVSGKKGKYSISIPVSISDNKNDFIIYYTKSGMGPKMAFANAFIPKAEYEKYKSASYEVELNAPMIPTTITDVMPDKPFAKIKWDIAKQHKFVQDPGFVNVAHSEELKILGNPDAYYAAIVKKNKKKEDALAKNKAAADAKLKAAEEEARKKAEEEANRLAAIKAKEEADRLERERAEAALREQRQKRIADSLAALARNKPKVEAPNQTEIAQAETPDPAPDPVPGVIPVADPLRDFYDASAAYSINLAKKTLSEIKARRSAERAQNLTAKYETNNVLTSLLNEVEEFDRISKKR